MSYLSVESNVSTSPPSQYPDDTINHENTSKTKETDLVYNALKNNKLKNEKSSFFVKKIKVVFHKCGTKISAFFSKLLNRSSLHTKKEIIKVPNTINRTKKISHFVTKFFRYGIRPEQWRANEKYEHTLSQIHRGIYDTIATMKNPLELHSLLQEFEVSPNYNTINFSNEKDFKDYQKAFFYTKDVIHSLKKNNKKFSTKREQYKYFKTAFRRALTSDYYRRYSSPSSSSPLVALLNTIAYAEFTCVDMQSFTGSVTNAIAQKGHNKISKKRHVVPNDNNAEKPSQVNHNTSRASLRAFHEMLDFLPHYHNCIQSRRKEQLLTKIRGEVRFGFDPSKQGNPPNVKFRINDKDNRLITSIRTPSPTIGNGKVSPEFKAFLRHLKSNDKKYTMINFQKRSKTSKIFNFIGLNGEFIRSRNLEKLGDVSSEFSGVIDVFTFDKNGGFYQQKMEKKEIKNTLQLFFEKQWITEETYKGLKKKKSNQIANSLTQSISEIQQKDSNTQSIPYNSIIKSSSGFIEECVQNLLHSNTGCFIPETWKIDDNKITAIKNKLAFIHESFFNGKNYLNIEERRDFIEIFYLFLTDFILEQTNANYYNGSCSNCMDRGGAANWLVIAFMSLLNGATREEIDRLPQKLEEDAFLVRKRAIITERLNRAKTAFKRVVDAIEKNATLVESLKDQFYMKNLHIPNKEELTVKDKKLIKQTVENKKN